LTAVSPQNLPSSFSFERGALERGREEPSSGKTIFRVHATFQGRILEMTLIFGTNKGRIQRCPVFSSLNLKTGEL